MAHTRCPTAIRVVVGVAVAVVLAGGATSCNRSSKPSGEISVLVTDRVVPVGKATNAAINDGSIKPTKVPADVAPEDAVQNVSDIVCLVPSQGIPAGVLLRKSMFVKPQDIGLERGLALNPADAVPCD